MSNERLTAERLRDIRLAVADYKSGGFGETRDQIEADRTDLMQEVETLLADRAALERRVAELEEALRPFANAAKASGLSTHGAVAMQVEFQFLRAAAKALAGE